MTIKMYTLWLLCSMCCLVSVFTYEDHIYIMYPFICLFHFNVIANLSGRHACSSEHTCLLESLKCNTLYVVFEARYFVFTGPKYCMPYVWLLYKWWWTRCDKLEECIWEQGIVFNTWSTFLILSVFSFWHCIFHSYITKSPFPAAQFWHTSFR